MNVLSVRPPGGCNNLNLTGETKPPKTQSQHEKPPYLREFVANIILHLSDQEAKDNPAADAVEFEGGTTLDFLTKVV